MLFCEGIEAVMHDFHGKKMNKNVDLLVNGQISIFTNQRFEGVYLPIV